MRLKPKDNLAELIKQNNKTIQQLLDDSTTIEKDWADYEPAPIEFFHGRLMELFYEFRKTHGTTGFKVSMTGIDLNNIIAKAKMETYEKYRKLNLGRVIHKSELNN